MPLIENSKGVSYWNAAIYSDEEYISAVFVILLVNQLFIISYGFFRSKLLGKTLQSGSMRSRHEHRRSPMTTRDSLALCSVAFGVAVLIVIFYRFDIQSILIRSYRSSSIDSIQFNNAMEALLFGVFRYTPILFFIYAVYNFLPAKKTKAFLLVMGLICAFPTAIPRFAAAALYIPLLLMAFPALAASQWLPLLIIVGLFFVFPMLDQFRIYSNDPSAGLSMNVKSDWLLDGHFDSFQSFLIVHSENFISFGWQLMGNILFFVPREVWPTKPVGTGMHIAELFGLSWANIAANYYAEAYANFGYFGMALFSLALAWYCARLDIVGIAATQKISRHPILYPYYLISIGHLFIILRGDLNTGITSSVSFLIPLIIAHSLCTRRNPQTA